MSKSSRYDHKKPEICVDSLEIIEDCAAEEEDDLPSKPFGDVTPSNLIEDPSRQPFIRRGRKANDGIR